MTPESIRMSELIMEAEQKCLENGHDMDWRRYNDYTAKANCRVCEMPVYISITHRPYIRGSALTTKCYMKWKEQENADYPIQKQRR